MGGAQCVYRIQCPVTSTAFPIPTGGGGKFVGFRIYSGSVVNGSFEGPYGQVALSTGAAPNLVLNQTNNFSSTGSMQSGMTILNGELHEMFIPFLIQSGSYNVSSSVVVSDQRVCSGSVICSSTGGFFEVLVMQGR